MVSPGELQRERDYAAKRLQYQDRGIPEYWLIDPDLQAVIVLWLEAKTYVKVVTFRSQDSIIASLFSKLQLTATNFLQPDIQLPKMQSCSSLALQL